MALDPRSRRSRNRRWRAAAGLLLGTVAVAALYLRTRPEPLCADPAPRLASIWDAEHKELVRSAFTRDHPTLGEDTFVRVEETLDGYANEWRR